MTLLLIILLVLPIAIRSMQEVLGRGPDPLYRLATGQVVDVQQADAAQHDSTYVNFGLVGLDESTGEVTIAVSGNRNCTGACPKIDLLLASLDNDADTRRGLPPSVDADAQTGRPGLQQFGCTARAWAAKSLSL